MKISLLNKCLFFLLSLTLFVGFYFGEDSAGSGGFVRDFNHTWGYIEVLKKSFFALPSQWALHTPLHYIILSKIYIFIENKYFIRLIFCTFSIFLPFLFYLCLKINYPNQDSFDIFQYYS